MLNFQMLRIKTPLYDSYIKAFKWASHRIKDKGVISFVTNAGWIDGNSTSGLRKCFQEEFSKIYIVNLRGNARTSGEARKKKVEMSLEQEVSTYCNYVSSKES